MLHKFLSNSSFHILLRRLDYELAEKLRQKGCPSCGGKLHCSDYPRSPFGVASAFRSYYQTRQSFCCAKCRKRTTPPSVRFFGRFWYCAPLFLLINALSGRSSIHRLMSIQRHFGFTISKKTWHRWRRWWREYFPTISFLKQIKGLLPVQAHHGPFPRMLLAIYSGGLEIMLIASLQLLAPITAGALRAV